MPFRPELRPVRASKPDIRRCLLNVELVINLKTAKALSLEIRRRCSLLPTR
jgi:hypothetical protein